MLYKLMTKILVTSCSRCISMFLGNGSLFSLLFCCYVDRMDSLKMMGSLLPLLSILTAVIHLTFSKGEMKNGTSSLQNKQSCLLKREITRESISLEQTIVYFPITSLNI